jgi:hypothetical protein
MALTEHYPTSPAPSGAFLCRRLETLRTGRGTVGAFMISQSQLAPLRRGFSLIFANQVDSHLAPPCAILAVALEASRAGHSAGAGIKPIALADPVARAWLRGRHLSTRAGAAALYAANSVF